jgi:hypothetical protein
VGANVSVVPFLVGAGVEVAVEESQDSCADTEQMTSVDLFVTCRPMASIERSEGDGLHDAVAVGTGLAGVSDRTVDSFREYVEIPIARRRRTAHHASTLLAERSGRRATCPCRTLFASVSLAGGTPSPRALARSSSSPRTAGYSFTT